MNTIEMLPLSVRAAVSSVNKTARTVDVIFSTGAAVDRVDWNGARYREVLSMDPAHVRLDRLNAGAPVLNSHAAYSVGDILGTVATGSARIAGGKGIATIRFSARDAVDAIFQDIVDGIVGNVSVGYRVHKMQETAPRAGEIVTRTAIDWEPYEISMVPMPADPGARVRGDHGGAIGLNRCVVEIRGLSLVPGITDAERIAQFERLKAAGESNTTAVEREETRKFLDWRQSAIMVYGKGNC